MGESYDISQIRQRCGIKLYSSPHKRIKEIEEMTENVSAGKIYLTAFLDFKTFKKFSETLAWETEVWIADMPDHMIHLNGDKFLGPRK
ncbi:MAG: BsuBI/PstI family type II restriction endonuclease [Finegoldia magna]|nr:BsuBI/PstI family type II restriction endonuclease [Finegoldia magna]